MNITTSNNSLGLQGFGAGGGRLEGRSHVYAWAESSDVQYMEFSWVHLIPGAALAPPQIDLWKLESKRERTQDSLLFSSLSTNFTSRITCEFFALNPHYVSIWKHEYIFN